MSNSALSVVRNEGKTYAYGILKVHPLWSYKKLQLVASGIEESIWKDVFQVFYILPGDWEENDTYTVGFRYSEDREAFVYCHEDEADKIAGEPLSWFVISEAEYVDPEG